MVIVLWTTRSSALLQVFCCGCQVLGSVGWIYNPLHPCRQKLREQVSQELHLRDEESTQMWITMYARSKSKIQNASQKSDDCFARAMLVGQRNVKAGSLCQKTEPTFWDSLSFQFDEWLQQSPMDSMKENTASQVKRARFADATIIVDTPSGRTDRMPICAVGHCSHAVNSRYIPE